MNASDNDGWEDVTDVRAIKAIAGTKGVAAAAKAQPVVKGADEAAKSVGGLLETPTRRDMARGSLLLINRLQPALDEVRRLQKKTLGATGITAVGEYNPFSSANQEYDAAVAGLTALARPATRTTGEGSMSDFESRLAVAALPNRWKRDAANIKNLDGLQALIDTHRDFYSRQLGLGPAQPRQLPQAPPSARGKPTQRPSADDLRSKYGLK
ncbi:hypothetical protein ACMGDM_10295 [Sphingomonas sp. DT-51]|uniref:hypothetical protein n=1 Tax=Sphingomonas sp. DT-51 TaxID=3396165 RepID=UPI003F1B24BB